MRHADKPNADTLIARSMLHKRRAIQRRSAHARPALFICSSMVVPKVAGDSVTTMPASRMAWIFVTASPLPPDTMAPAWPVHGQMGGEPLHLSERAGLE